MDIPQSYMLANERKFAKLVPTNNSHHTCSDCALLGVSPFSGFFTTVVIEALIRWTEENFQHFFLFIPDEPTYYSLKAFGYEDSKARKKAKRQCNYLKNKCLTALKTVNRKYSEDMIITYDFLNKNYKFLSLLERINSQYIYNEEFKKEIDGYSENFLRERNVIASKESIVFSSKYLISELPFFISSPEILGKNGCTFVYPKIPKIIKSFLEGKGAFSTNSKTNYQEYRME